MNAVIAQNNPTTGYPSFTFTPLGRYLKRPFLAQKKHKSDVGIKKLIYVNVGTKKLLCGSPS